MPRVEIKVPEMDEDAYRYSNLELYYIDLSLPNVPTEYCFTQQIYKLTINITNETIAPLEILINENGTQKPVYLAQEWSVFFDTPDTTYITSGFETGGGPPQITIKSSNIKTVWAFGQPQFKGNRSYLLTFKLIKDTVYIMWTEWTTEA